MAPYRLAGQEFCFPDPIPELEPYGITSSTLRIADQAIPNFFTSLVLSCHTVGLLGGEKRKVETWSAPPGRLLKVAGGSEFYLAPGGEYIRKVGQVENGSETSLTILDRDILLGPALVLALALRGVWSLHASAAMYKENVILFLGESGQGKSTLTAYLSQSAGWRLVADDILPVTADSGGMEAWPHFPQLKLPIQEQPGPGLVEHIPINSLCLLETTARGITSELNRLSPGQATRTLLSHTAGTRLFDAELLGRHLDFCAHSAAQVPVYRLAYPHRRDALPVIKELLESLC